MRRYQEGDSETSMEIDTRNSFIADASYISTHSILKILIAIFTYISTVSTAISTDDVNSIAEEIIDDKSAKEQDDVNTALKNIRIKKIAQALKSHI